MYVLASAVHNTIPGDRLTDPAAELKALTGREYRRTDHFIQLAVLGAHKVAAVKKPAPDTAVYLTSGQGNIAVFERICNLRRRENQLPRPVDFINLLSNSAGFYVASHLGLEAKNLFVSHHHFPVQTALSAAENDLTLKRHEMVLLGGVDQWYPRRELGRRLLGVPAGTRMGEGSNWLLLASTATGARARIEVWPHVDNKVLSHAGEEIFLAFSPHVSLEQRKDFFAQYPQCRPFRYEDDCGYYETLPLFVINSFLERKSGSLIHIDCRNNRTMAIMVARLQQEDTRNSEK